MALVGFGSLGRVIVEADVTPHSSRIAALTTMRGLMEIDKFATS
jgi:hypothetical protein